MRIRIIFGVLLVLGLVVILPTSAQAGSYVCQVSATGVVNGFPAMLLTCVPQAGYDYFDGMIWASAGADVTVANRILATALTAVSAGKPVIVVFPGTNMGVISWFAIIQ